MKKIINSMLVLIILLLLILPGIIYIKKTHNDSLKYVMEKEILEASEKCINEDVCKDDKISIRFLIENKYLEKVYDPITKEVVNDESYVEDNKLVIVK